MSIEELNQLRPQDRIIYTVASTATRGRVISVWRDDRIQVEWVDGSTDYLDIDEDTAKHVSRWIKK